MRGSIVAALFGLSFGMTSANAQPDPCHVVQGTDFYTLPSFDSELIFGGSSERVIYVDIIDRSSEWRFVTYAGGPHRFKPLGWVLSRQLRGCGERRRDRLPYGPPDSERN